MLYVIVIRQGGVMLTVRLDPGLESLVERYAQAHSMKKSDVVREALQRYLDDAEDAALAEAALHEVTSSKPLKQLRQELGLDG